MIQFYDPYCQHLIISMFAIYCYYLNPSMSEQKKSSSLEKEDQTNIIQEHSSVNESARGEIRMEMIPFEIELQEISSNARSPPKIKVSVERNIGMQARAVLIVSSCLFYFGFNRAMIAAVVNSHTNKQFYKLFNFTGNIVTTNAFLSIMISIGALCGTIACSFFMKYYSPKQIIFFASFCALIFTIITMYTNIIILMIFRLGVGWTIGTFVAIIPSFIKEITSKNVAPYFGTAPVINESLGGLVAFLLGFGLYEAIGTVRETWIIMCSLNIIPLIIVLICLKWDVIYESPLYLLKTGYRKKAEEIYKKIYSPTEIGKIISEKQIEIKRFHFKELKMLYLHKKYQILRRKDTVIAAHLPMLRRMTGMLIILLSSGSMIKAVDPKYERMAPIFISLVYFISCFLSNILVRYLPRRVIFQIGTVSACVCNLIISISFWFNFSPALILVFEGIILIMYGLTLGPVVWPYLTEVVPARIIPLAQSMNWVIDCFTLYLPGVIIAHKGNPWPMFLVFFVWDLCSIFINHVFIVETKNKTVTEIIESLNKK